MKKILVTTDFSRNSKAGIRFAIQLASQAPCELIFYYVNTIAAMDAWSPINFKNPNASNDLLLKDKLNTFIRKIYRDTGKEAGKIDCIIDDSHDVDTAIISYAQKRNADYVCMSTRGGGIINKFMGTNASSLITSSPVPLIVVPHTYRMKPLKSVLYASDIDQVAAELKTVEKFAKLVDAEIGVYHYDYFIEQEEVKSKLNKIADKYRLDNVSFHFRKFNAELSLLLHLKDDIRKSKPSIVAMFTKQNRSWFDRLFLSSKTAELGFDTKTPMLVFRK